MPENNIANTIKEEEKPKERPHPEKETLRLRIERQQKECIEAFKKTWTITGACLKVGINRTTLYSWMKRYPKFYTEMDEIKKQHVDYVEGKLIKAIEEDELGAIIFFLKNNSRTYRPKSIFDPGDDSEEITKVSIEIVRPKKDDRSKNEKHGGVRKEPAGIPPEEIQDNN